jgi:hypothetical protein
MSHKLFYKPDALYAHCGYGNHEQNLIFHFREMVLEKRPVIKVWFVLSAAYRVLFRDLMDSLGVGGEDNIKMYLREVGWGGLDLVDMAEDRDR